LKRQISLSDLSNLEKSSTTPELCVTQTCSDKSTYILEQKGKTFHGLLLEATGGYWQILSVRSDVSMETIRKHIASWAGCGCAHIERWSGFEGSGSVGEKLRIHSRFTWTIEDVDSQPFAITGLVPLVVDSVAQVNDENSSGITILGQNCLKSYLCRGCGRTADLFCKICEGMRESRDEHPGFYCLHCGIEDRVDSVHHCIDGTWRAQDNLLYLLESQINSPKFLHNCCLGLLQM